MKIASWMVSPVQTVGVGTPIGAVATRMQTHGIRHLPVVDASGRYSSMVTDFVFALRGRFISGLWVPWKDNDGWLLAGAISHAAEVLVHADDDLIDVLKKLRDTQQDCVWVVDDNRRPIGVLTEHDVVRHACELLPENEPAKLVARTNLPLVEHDRPATEARAHLAENQIRHALVVRQQRLIGVLAYRDVALEQSLEGLDARDVSNPPISHHGDLTARQAARILYKEKIGCLPLLDKTDRPVAIVTRKAILSEVIGLLDR